MVKFAENGSLLDYIRKHKKQPDYINTMEDESSALSNIQTLQLVHGIAKGMNHLAKVKVIKPTKCYIFAVSSYRAETDHTGPSVEEEN